MNLRLARQLALSACSMVALIQADAAAAQTQLPAPQDPARQEQPADEIVVVGSQIKGDIYYNPGLGYALAVGMVVVMAVMMTIYYSLRRRSERWLRK